MKKRIAALMVLILFVCSINFPVFAEETMDNIDIDNSEIESDDSNDFIEEDNDDEVLTAGSEEYVSGNYKYILDENNNAIITQYIGSEKIVNIPANLNGHKVVSIGGEAFMDCSSLTNVTIPNGVTKIGGRAFLRCSNLTNIVIPNSVKELGRLFDGFVFQNCSRLTSVTLSSNITSIFEGTFSGCSSLTDVTIPDGVTKIGGYAFSGCSNLKNIIIPNSVEVIQNNAFQDCSSLTSITIPNSVKEIGSGIFQRCSGLKSIIIPDSVTETLYATFSGCSSLTSVVLPNSLKGIGSYTFQGCSSLKSITIPNSVKSIGLEAFVECSSLTSITIPDSVTNIDYRAFRDCSSLTSIIIPSSVTWMGSSGYGTIVEGCNNLTAYVYPNSYALEYVKKENIPYKIIGVDVAEPPIDNNPSIIPPSGQMTEVIEDVDKITIDINGKGKAHAVFTVRDDEGKILKNQVVTYKMHNAFGELEKTETITTDENGIANIVWQTDKKSEVTNPTGNTITRYFIVDLYPCDNSEIDTTAPLKKAVEVTININPLSFSQEWEGVAKVDLEAKLGAGAGASVGVAKAKAEIASAAVNGGIGVSMKVKNEYDKGKRNLTLTDTFSPKIGGKISAGAKADLEVPGMEADLSLISGKAGVKVGQSTTVGQTITDYDPDNASNALDIGKFLIGCEALNSGNAIMLELAEEMGFSQCNYFAKNNNIALNAGASIGKIDTTIFEGTVASANYDSSLNYSTAKDKRKNTKSYTFKKTAGISGKLGDIEMKTGDTDGLTGFKYASTHGSLTTDYSLTKTIDEKNANSVTIKHMSGYDDAGLFMGNKSQKTEVSYTYRGDELNKIKNNNNIIKRFDEAKPIFVFDSAAKNVYEDMVKADAYADYARSYTEGEVHNIPLSIGAQLGVGLEAGFELGSAYELSYDYETGRFKKGITYVEAENDIDKEVKANTMEFSTILVEPMNAVVKEAGKYISKVFAKVGEVLSSGYATLKSAANYVATEGYNIVILTIDGVKDIFSAKVISSYYIDDVAGNEELVHMSAINSIDESLPIQMRNAITLGKAYVISVVEDKEDGKVLKTFEDMPQDLTISYTDEMLTEIALSDEDEKNIDIYIYSEELCGYIPVGGTLDTKNKSVKATITQSGQYVLGCTIADANELDELPKKEGYGRIIYAVGDDVTIPSYADKYYEEGYKKKITTVPTRIGYQFCGWYSDSTLKKKAKITKKTTGDITLYPKWKGCSYQVQYMANPLNTYDKPIGKQKLKLEKNKMLKQPNAKKLEKANVSLSMNGWTQLIKTTISGNEIGVENWLSDKEKEGKDIEVVKTYYSTYSDETTITYIDRAIYVNDLEPQKNFEQKCFESIEWQTKGKGYKGEIKLYPLYKN